MIIEKKIITDPNEDFSNGAVIMNRQGEFLSTRTGRLGDDFWSNTTDNAWCFPTDKEAVAYIKKREDKLRNEGRYDELIGMDGIEIKPSNCYSCGETEHATNEPGCGCGDEDDDISEETIAIALKLVKDYKADKLSSLEGKIESLEAEKKSYQDALDDLNKELSRKRNELDRIKADIRSKLLQVFTPKVADQIIHDLSE